MPPKVRCPACNKKGRVSEQDAGQQVLCPACGVRFDAPLAPRLGPLAAAAAPAHGAAGAAPPPIDPQHQTEPPETLDDRDELVPIELERAVLERQETMGQVEPTGPSGN